MKTSFIQHQNQRGGGSWEEKKTLNGGKAVKKSRWRGARMKGAEVNARQGKEENYEERARE